MKKNQKYQSLNNGSILILSTFLILAITMISVTYWKLIQIRIQILSQKKYSTQAFYAARAGIEDAIYEFRMGNDWDITQVNNNWTQKNETTFYKTNINSSSLSYFDYPVSFSVSVIGDINNGFVTINSSASISNEENIVYYQKSLVASITRSFDNEIIIHAIKEP
ncbi:hypothetical protein CL658_01090 [bacterium]|nr:hypothetical protein [bacterium]|tara:strand:- start:135 stop:629 length:495 start_codon:yes stop_codon:yes gene_type:complete